MSASNQNNPTETFGNDLEWITLAEPETELQ